jgi:hypothetical protein
MEGYCMRPDIILDTSPSYAGLIVGSMVGAAMIWLIVRWVNGSIVIAPVVGAIIRWLDPRPGPRRAFRRHLTFRAFVKSGVWRKRQPD